MKLPFPFPLRPWMIAPVGAGVFLVWIGILRIRHLDYLETAAGAPVAMSATSSTGYAGGVRQFIPGTRDAISLQPIAQTQQMFARGEWRVRQADYDNVPEGRPVWSASPYRWWLGAVALVDHVLTGRPPGAAVEQAALFADPLLQLLLIAGTTVYVARRFGTFTAALLALALAGLVPFSAAFIPGQPRRDGLAAIAAFWSILPLLIVCARNDRSWNVRRYFLLAGVIGGFGLWLGVGGELPVLVGIALGGLLAAWLARRAGLAIGPLPWRPWAAGGAVACLAAYVIEFIPGQTPGWRMDIIHPLHGMAWLGVGELLARADLRLRGLKRPRRKRDLALIALAALALVTPLVLAFHQRHDLLRVDPSLFRLTTLTDSAVAKTIWTWASHEGLSGLVLATVAPVLLLAPLVWLVARRRTGAGHRSAAMIALGPVCLTLIVASFHLRRWVQLDATLLAALVVGASSVEPVTRRRMNVWLWAGATALVLVPCVATLLPAVAVASVSTPELESLIERDLGHWLANRAGPGRAAIIASPNLAASLAFEGGLRSLGSPYPGNRAGLELSLRIAGATSQDEALALVQRHQITHIILASWDPSLEQLTQLGGQGNKSLVALLHRWLPPRWLRPVPYRMPEVPGFEDQSVVVFEVVDLQDNALALSHLAEYFVETDRTDLAGMAAIALGRTFPDDLGAQVARVQAASAGGLPNDARDAFKTVEARLAEGGAKSLPWDQRVSLAIVLAEAKRFDQAREQMARCLTEVSEPSLRSLTPVTLYRFVTLARALGLNFADPHLEELAHQLLPPEMRGSS